ncbi:hypothetical protein LPJ53_004312 [Coemansia erecta]|uniref:Amino acid transporter transmembrane domain-containing protein n=1 Tax=Coemansia erecta TaxID=147472 RepID=A0A9W7XZC7_9FUNG|nr:hypothetical protein LPJ53_004312 [Coemansia erecta]
MPDQTSGAGRRGVHTPLLHGRPRRGGASARKAFVLLAKAFVGSGMLFLPRAFSNGGLLASALLLLLVAAASLHTMQQLVHCHQRLCQESDSALPVSGSGGYGALAQRAYGRWLRRAVELSVVASQLGFACAGSVFVATSLRDAVNALTACRWHAQLPLGLWVAAQALPLAPLCLVRHVRGFSRVALLADLAILLGLAYILSTSTASLARQGPGPHVTPLLNPAGFSLFLGSAAYTFEGYALILPIAAAMRRPAQFPRLLRLVMALCAAVAVAVGSLGYAAFGDQTAPIVLLNMPARSWATQGVRGLYALAIIGTTPLMMFPAYRLIERPAFRGSSGKQFKRVKAGKNMFRLVLLAAVLGVAQVGAGRLDRLVAIIGGAACVPLAFVYPPLIHCRLGGAAASGRWRRARDLGFALAGTALSVYVTAGAIERWSVEETPYDFCQAEIPPH